MTKNKHAVLIDIDGTLVDNFAFEKSVTRFIIRHTAKLKSIPISVARRLWEESLSRERDSIKWYDYDYHCFNLDMPALSMEAHQKAIDHLREIKGAQTTWDLLIEYFAGVYVVSEAPKWVMELKLKTLRFSGYVDLLSSQDIGVPKDSSTFWFKLKTMFLHHSPALLIDNKVCNLVGASTSMGKLIYVLFKRGEHSMTLPETIRPTNSVKCRPPSDIYVIHDHYELQRLIRNKFGINEDGKQRETRIPARG